MNHAYKFFAVAVVLVAIIFGSMEVSYRAAHGEPAETGAAPKAPQPAANMPKPVIIPAPNAPPPQVETPDPAAAVAVATPDIAANDPAAPPPLAGAPTVSAEGQEPAPMVIIPAEGQ